MLVILIPPQCKPMILCRRDGSCLFDSQRNQINITAGFAVDVHDGGEVRFVDGGGPGGNGVSLTVLNLTSIRQGQQLHFYPGPAMVRNPYSNRKRRTEH